MCGAVATVADPLVPEVWARRISYGTALALGLAVAAMGYTSSFSNLSKYAGLHGYPFPAALPIGLDLGIPALLILDWLRASPFLRTAAWSLAALTVFANGAVAGGTMRDRLLHAALPAIAILIVEAARHLRADPARMDRIRLSRYLVAPVRTLRLRARMVAWEVTSYSEALKLESAILYARAVLAAEYGQRSWRRTRKQVPVILVHELRTGQLPDGLFYGDWRGAVLSWVRDTLNDLDPHRRPGPAEPDRSELVSEPVPAGVLERDPWDRVWDRLDSLDCDGLTPEQMTIAYAVARRHFDQVGRHIVADKLRGPVGIGKPKALTLATTLRTAYETASDQRSPHRIPNAPGNAPVVVTAATGTGPAGTAGISTGPYAAAATP